MGYLQCIDVIGSDVHLPIVFLGIKLLEFKKLDLNAILLYHQVPLVVSALHLKT